MSATTTSPQTAAHGHDAPVLLKAKDLPAFCPNPAMPRWSAHPRVFIDVTTSGEGRCPYCGTRYVLDGPAPAGH